MKYASTRINTVLVLVLALAAAVAFAGCDPIPTESQPQDGITEPTTAPLPVPPDSLVGHAWIWSTSRTTAEGDWLHETIRLFADGAYDDTFASVFADGTTSTSRYGGTWSATATELTMTSDCCGTYTSQYTLTLGAQQADAVLVINGVTWWLGL